MKKLTDRIKRAIKSWTVNWGLLLSLAGYFQENVTQVLPIVKQFIPDENVGGFLMVVGLVVILLRFKTTQPISER